MHSLKKTRERDRDITLPVSPKSVIVDERAQAKEKRRRVGTEESPQEDGIAGI